MLAVIIILILFHTFITISIEITKIKMADKKRNGGKVLFPFWVERLLWCIMFIGILSGGVLG